MPQLHPANSEFSAEATSLLDHEIGPARADYSSARPCFVESKPTDSADPQFKIFDKDLAQLFQGITSVITYGLYHPEKLLIGYARVSTFGQTLDG